MSAPPKPWENSGAGGSRTFQMPAAVDQSMLGQISGNNASQPTALLGPPPTAGQPRRRPPAAPTTAANLRTQPYTATSAMQSAYGSTYPSTYPSTYGNAYGSTYGGAYGSTLGSYGSTFGSYGLGSYGTGLGSYGSTYGSSYGSPYGGYGMGSAYGSYGTYGQRYGGYSPYGPQAPTAESRLVAMAAESSRPAFESIESVVQTVGSVSFMLESTLGALHSSFRAVLAVADHLGRLRAIFSAMAIFRLARTLYAKLMQMLGLYQPTHDGEAAWAAAAPDANSGSSWPLAAFVAVVVGAPYLAFRLLQRLAPQAPPQPPPQHLAPPSNDLPAWLSSGQPVWRATSRYDFVPETAGELPLRANQPVFLAPQRLQTLHDGWVLASDGNASGLVPKSYIGDVAHVSAPGAASNRAPARSGPAMPTAEPTISPAPAEPVISPTSQDDQPGKPTE